MRGNRDAITGFDPQTPLARFDESSLVNLVFGVLIRVSERWRKTCFSEFEQQQIRSLRERLKLDEHAVSTQEPTTEPQSRRSATSAA